MPTGVGLLKAAKYIRAEGSVWCHVHGCIHGDTTDPFDCADDRCTTNDHRPVFYRAKRGDWEE